MRAHPTKTVETAGTSAQYQERCARTQLQAEPEGIRAGASTPARTGCVACVLVKHGISIGGRHGCRLYLSVVCLGRSHNRRTGIVWEFVADAADAASLLAARSSQGQARGALC